MKRGTAVTALRCFILLGGIVAGAVPVSGAILNATSTTAQADQCELACDRLNVKTTIVRDRLSWLSRRLPNRASCR